MKHTVFAVDLADQLLNIHSELLVDLEVGTAWNCHLHQDDFPDPIWVSLEEGIKGMKFLRYSFDVVQAVNTNDDRCASKVVSHAPDHVLDTFFLEAVVELRGLDAYREGPNRDYPATNCDLGVIMRAIVP